MADLDEMSAVIGEIRADIKYVRHWQDMHEIRDEERFRSLAGRIELANGYSGRISVMEAAVKEMTPIMEGSKKTKWMVAGFFTGISIVGGLLGSIAAHLIPVIN